MTNDNSLTNKLQGASYCVGCLGSAEGWPGVRLAVLKQLNMTYTDTSSAWSNLKTLAWQYRKLRVVAGKLKGWQVPGKMR